MNEKQISASSNRSTMNRTLISALLVGMLACATVAQRAANHADRFNPSGDYHPLNRQTDYLSLQFHLQVRYKRRGLVAWGRVYGSESRFYKFKSVSVTKKRLRFSTHTHHGVRYDFDGSFLRGGNFTTSLDIPGSVPLRGTLRKYINGKKVMELNTSFTYYVGC